MELQFLKYCTIGKMICLFAIAFLLLVLPGCFLPELPAISFGDDSGSREDQNNGGEIPDLASIKVGVDVYTDRPDDKITAGIVVNIFFYNKNSEVIEFRNIPFTASIEVFGYKDEAGLLTDDNPELLWKKEFTLDHSPGIMELLQNKYIRIPYSEIGSVKERELIEFGAVKVTVNTSSQGPISGMKLSVPLIPVEVTRVRLDEIK